MRLGLSIFTLIRLPARANPHAIGSAPSSVNSLSKPADRQNISSRLLQLLPQDLARWGTMSVHQMICHLDDSYKVALGEKYASPATGFLQKTLLKRLALDVPLQWGKGFPTRPELEQGNGGGSPPIEFRQDVDSLLSTFGRFCDALPTPHLPHPIFGTMTVENWMRWGYLHADHHLRQFGR
jgi:hypothetical protein